MSSVCKAGRRAALRFALADFVLQICTVYIENSRHGNAV